jgi:hypothetical protein
MRDDQPAGRRVRQELIRTGVDFGVMPRGECEAGKPGTAGGVTIEDMECDAFSHDGITSSNRPIAPVRPASKRKFKRCRKIVNI